MRRFRFRLQPILEMREYVEQQQKLELGKLAGECALLREEIAARAAERRRRLSAIPAGERDDVAFRRTLETYTNRLLREEGSLGHRLDGRESERTKAADRYRDAKRAADVLRKLRDNRSIAHRAAAIRAEQLVLDEVARNTYLRSEVLNG